MSCPRDQDICLRRGDYKAWNLTFAKNGSALDISDTDFWITIKENEEDADVDAVLQKKITFPADADSLNGIGTLELLKTDTDSLDPTIRYYYDMQWVNGSGEPITTAAGRVKVLPDITRSTA